MSNAARWLYWYDGAWFDSSPRLTGPADNAFWMATCVFDGARCLGSRAPDLDLHCARLIASAEALMLRPKLTAEDVAALCVQAIRRFPPDTELYLRPMLFAREGFLLPDADGTDFALAVGEIPLPDPEAMFTACLSPHRRPWPDMAPTNAKAACLYPNSQRALADARRRGFDTAVVLDGDANVAEFAMANLMLSRDGRVLTPALNGTFLAGITRARVIGLLRDDGYTVEETAVTTADLLAADEIFSTGNLAKVVAASRYEDHAVPHGPVARNARRLYFEWLDTQHIDERR
jgi:branched-chain amino acid aminotransferase